MDYITWTIAIVGTALSLYGLAKSPMVFLAMFGSMALALTLASELSPREYAEVAAWETLGSDIEKAVEQKRSYEGVLRYYDYLAIQDSAQKAIRKGRG